MSVSAIGRFAGKAFNYAKRAAKVYPPVVFGSGQEVLGSAYKKALTTKNPFKGDFWKGLWKGTKEAGKAAEQYAKKEELVHGNFFKSCWKSIKTIPQKIAAGWRAGGMQAKRLGKNEILGKLGGAFKGIGKRMPVIGSLMIIGFELPNIIKATVDEGIVQGLAETAKAGARLGGATLLGAIGTAIGGPIGGIVGFIAGDWITSKIVGKSYSERKAEEEEKMAAAKPTQQTFTANDYAQNPMSQVNPFQQMLMYEQLMNGSKMNDDILAKSYFNQLTEQNKLNYLG